jgi:hypothetical protein
MRLPLRRLSNTQLEQTYGWAQISLDGFRLATQRHGSLIQSWVGGASVVALEHYPEGGVVDRRRGSQFFYHSHRAGNTEHGHLHLFWHATRSGQRRYIRQSDLAKGGSGWGRSTAPSPLISIGLDARGLPISIFSVNHWVGDGHWFDADLTLQMLQKFELHDVSGHAESCTWLTAFVRLYEPVMAQVLRARDKVLHAQPDFAAALQDRSREVLSTARLDWADDLGRMEREMQLRGLIAT